ncbi:MAG: outer membrane protein [Rhizobiaceae bacterium]
MKNRPSQSTGANCPSIIMRVMRMAAFACLIQFLPGNYLHAQAADAVIEQPPEPPEPQYSQFDEWTGGYIGVYGGYSWLKSNISPGGNVNYIEGPIGGGYFGYNYQLGNNWVAGIELMGGASGAENSSGGVKIEQDWEASLRGRMGYAFENSLLYGLAGIGATGFKATGGGSSDNQVSLGWNIGAGIETKVTESVSGRVEYNYSDYEKQDFSIGNGKTSVDLNGHTIKLGVGLSF